MKAETRAKLVKAKAKKVPPKTLAGRRSRGALKPRDVLCGHLGDLFAHERAKAGISLEVMAAKLERSINTIRWHEAGTRLMRLDEVVRAAFIMGITPDSLCMRGCDGEAGAAISDDVQPPEVGS